MKPTVMHCVYEERVVKGVIKRQVLTHSIYKEKAYAAINEWREKEQLNEAEQSLRLFELHIEEGTLNREYGMYYCNWILFSKEAYEALRARKHRTGWDCGHAFK